VAETTLVHVVVDTPRGSRNKYKYDEKLGLFKLSRVLPAGMQFPHDFGSIPRTAAEDGDALDVLVLTDAATFVGCLLTVRLIGVLRAEQKEQGKTIRNDRLVAAVETAVNEPSARDVRDLPKQQVHEIEQFFVAYNRVHGRELTPRGRAGPATADRLLRKAMRAYDARSRP
jgi:inorganic pyrophosphatase